MPKSTVLNREAVQYFVPEGIAAVSIGHEHDTLPSFWIGSQDRFVAVIDTVVHEVAPVTPIITSWFSLAVRQIR